MSSPVLPDGITVYVYARTDVGMKRQGNEDSFLIADLSSGRLGLGPEVTAHQLGNQGSLMVVSDGLGGAAAGEVASAMAVQTVCTELMKSTKSVLSPSDRLKRATEQANDQIWSCAQSDNSLRGMGATLTAAFIFGSCVYIAQVGDSRAYIIRGGRVKQVTEDQSWANAVKKAGLEIADVPSNVILQALGTQPKVHVEVTSVDLLNGDVLLMCSDGLSNKIKDLEMKEIASEKEDLAANCQELIDLANKRGGEDNITVILARFEGKSLSKGFEEKDLSITSTFKVVAPLDFGENDENDTMSFRADELGKESVDPMSVTQSALFEGIPTISGIPSVPSSSKSSKETKPHIEVSPTSPLTSEPKAKNQSAPIPNTSPLSPIDDSGKKNLSNAEKTAFRQAETKTDLPAITPVFDLSVEPIVEPKSEAEPDINIEFVPTPLNEPRIPVSPVLPKPKVSDSPLNLGIPEMKTPKPTQEGVSNSKSGVVALPPKPAVALPPQANTPKPAEFKLPSENSVAEPTNKLGKTDGVVSLPAKPSPLPPPPIAPPGISKLPGTPSAGASKLPPPPMAPKLPPPPVAAPPAPLPAAPAVPAAPMVSPAVSAPPVPMTKPVSPTSPTSPVMPPSISSPSADSSKLPPPPVAPPAPKLPPPPAAPPVPMTKPVLPVPPMDASLTPAATSPIGQPPTPVTKPSAPVSPLFSAPGAPTTPSLTPSTTPIGKAPELPKPIAPPVFAPQSSSERSTLPSIPYLGKPLEPAAKNPILPPPMESSSSVAPPLPTNLFAPPPKPFSPGGSASTSSTSPDLAAPKIAPPPPVLPSAPLNLFGANSTSPLDSAPKTPGGVFSAPAPPRAVSPNAPRVDDFLENSLFSPAPPKPLPGPLPPSLAPKPSEPSLENSLFSPPSAPKSFEKADPLGVSTPGLIFPEAFKEKTAAPPPRKLDEEPDPIMLETLSAVVPEEPKSAPNSLFSPPSQPAPSVPLFAPPGVKDSKPNLPGQLFAPPTPNKATSAPSFMPPSGGANLPPPPANLPPPPAKVDNPGDPKPAKTGVEVLASLFSAPAPNKAPASTSEAKMPPLSPAMPPPPVGNPGVLPPPPARVEPPKESIKPAPPALVLPPSPKKADIPPLAPPPALKPSIPPLAPSKPEFAPPPIGISPIVPPPSEVKAPPLGVPGLPPLPPAPRQDGDAKKAPLFSPPATPAPPSKPVNLPPPPTPAATAKADLPPAPSLSSIPTPAPAPATKPNALPPPPVAVSKPSSFEDEEPLAKSPSPAFSEVGTTPLPKKGNQLNPKLVFALGGVVVAIVAIVVVIFTFSGSKQTGTDATPTPEASPEVTPTPEVVETPATTPTPVATKGAKNTPAPTPTPTLAEAPVPTDTAGLIKYALAQVTTILDRVQKELPDSDPTKAARQKSLGAYKEELARYVSKNIADDSARNYAESALSQIKGLKIQLDALPKPAAGKGKKGK